MADMKLGEILVGTPPHVARAYCNTLRSVYDALAPKVRDIDWHLSRFADEYCDTGIEDGVAIARDCYDLKEALSNIERNLDALEVVVAALETEAAKKESEVAK